MSDTTAHVTDPIDVLKPFRAHDLYPAAVRSVEREKRSQGRISALALARKIASEFEEVTLRETANRIRQNMESVPGFDCE